MSGEQKDLQVIVDESGLEPSKAQVLLEQFSDYFKIAADWEQKAKMLVVTEETQIGEMAMAREGRLFLREKRIAVEHTRKTLKEQSLREGKAIDGIANVLKALIVPIEDHLDAQEHFVENKRKAEDEARRLEAEKLLIEKEEKERLEKEAEERRVRAENVRLLKEAADRDIAEKKAREAADRKLAAERKAAEAKLAKERAAREKELAEERTKAEAERKAIEEKARQEREAERKKAAAEAEKVRKEAEAKAKKVAKEYEAKLAEQRRLASMVTCPKCGHKFSTEDKHE